MKRIFLFISAIMIFFCLCPFPASALHDEILARLGRGIISDIAFSPDSSILAVSTSRGTYFHNPSDFADLAFIDTGFPPYYGGSICFSPNGELLASSAREMTGAVILWDTATLEKVAEIKAGEYNGPTHSIKFSPDGKIIAFGGNDGKIRLLNVEEGKEIGVLDTDGGVVESVTFSPDGNLLGSVSGGYSVTLWDVTAFRAIRTFEFGRNIAFSPDGTLFAVGEKRVIGGSGVIRLYDMEQDEQGVINAGRFSRSLHFSPNSKLLMTGDWQGINLWDVRKLELADRIAFDLDIYHAHFSPDGHFLACAEFNKAMIWDMIAQRKIESPDEYMENISSVAISSDSRWLACGDTDSVKLWDLETYELLSVYKATRFGANGFLPFSVAISPDNKLLAAGSINNNNVMVWYMKDGKEFAVIDVNAPALPYVYKVAFSPDGELLAYGGSGGVKLWDIETRKEIWLDGNPGVVYSIAFSPDGKLLLGGGEKKAVHIWDIGKRKEIGKLKHEFIVYYLAYNPDGKWLAVGCLHSNEVKLWNMKSLKEATTLTAESQVGFVDFNNSECLLAVHTGFDVTLWDVMKQEKIAMFPVDGIYIFSGSFSPDNKFLALGTIGEVILWNTEPYADICDDRSDESDNILPITWGRIKQTELYQNYPNPFNPETWIPYKLAEDSEATINIYSASGQLVKALDLGNKKAGSYQAYWDGRNDEGQILSSGVYFYVLTASDGFTDTRKMVLLK